MPVTSYAIALGSNRRHHRHGAPHRVLAAAAAAIADLGSIGALSPVIRTPALGPAGRSFANAAVVLETDLAPPDLLDALKSIEREFGRRRGRRWGARVLDLDIILWSGAAWSDGLLTIPHPAYRFRAFVLHPLTHIAGDWRDPLDGRSVRQLRAAVDRRRPRP